MRFYLKLHEMEEGSEEEYEVFGIKIDTKSVKSSIDDYSLYNCRFLYFVRLNQQKQSLQYLKIFNMRERHSVLLLFLFKNGKC